MQGSQALSNEENASSQGDNIAIRLLLDVFWGEGCWQRHFCSEVVEGYAQKD